MSAESFYVRIAKEELVFAAAHFITFDKNVCERLHGHNYRVAAEIHGPLDENRYVADFIALRDILKEIVAPLDHHVLLPERHPQIQVEVSPEETTATYEDRRWVFPASDCTILPVENTTAELIARHIGRELLRRLQDRWGLDPAEVRVEVDECEGQVGGWRYRGSR